MASFSQDKEPCIAKDELDASGKIRIMQLSPVNERENEQRMTATGKGFFPNPKRPRSNRQHDSESMSGKFEEIARAT